MNSGEAQRYLRRLGIVITPKKGTGHLFLFNPANGKASELPVHGRGKELKTGLWKGILKQLGLE